MASIRNTIRLVISLWMAALVVQAAIAGGSPYYEVLQPNGQFDDGQASIFYDPATGEIAVDAPAFTELTSINIDSAGAVFTGDRAQNLNGSFDNHTPNNIFKALFGSSFGSLSFGNVAETGLAYDFMLNDLSVVGSLAGGGDLGDVDLIYAGPLVIGLLPGDANQDWSFDQQDLVQVLTAGKYVTGLPATWGEGDWDGGLGGEPGNPIPGNGFFDEFDIMAALGRDVFGTGPYAALGTVRQETESKVAVTYDARTGQVSVDAPADWGLTSIYLESMAGIFTGNPAQGLAGNFDTDTDNTIFKATFGASFGTLSFGAVAPWGLDEDFLRDDLTVIGTRAGGGELGDVTLVYVPIPEPASIVLLAMALAGMWGVVGRTPRPSLD